MVRLLLITALVLAVHIGHGAASNASVEECRALGYTGTALCSDCERMSSVVHDDTLTADCRKCCIEDTKEGEGVLYDKAVLEVCPWYLQGLPELKQFIEKHSKEISDLTVKQAPGRPPMLKLRTKDGASPPAIGAGREEVRVDAWKTEHILSFLRQKLKAAGAAKIAAAK